jgi:hypothetical protein
MIQLTAGAAYGVGREAPDLIRCAQTLFPGLPALKNAHYIKHNKITQGQLTQGDLIPSVRLHDLVDGSIVDLNTLSMAPLNPAMATNIDGAATASNNVTDYVSTFTQASCGVDVGSGAAAASFVRPVVIAAGSYT